MQTVEVNQTIASAQQFADASVRCRHQMQIVSLLATRIASFFRIAGMEQCLALSRWAGSFDPRRRAPIYSHREFEGVHACNPNALLRSEEHTSELQSLMRISYAVFC